MDSIKGAIVLRARLEELGVADPQPLPANEEGALPLFGWVTPAPASDPPASAP
jgi:hypothetical protein